MTKFFPLIRKSPRQDTFPARGTDREYLPHAQELLSTPPRTAAVLAIWDRALS